MALAHDLASLAEGEPRAHAEAHVEHLTPVPLLVGLGTLAVYLGLGYRDVHGVFAVLGALAFIAPFVLWVREDVQMWKAHHVDPGLRPGGRDTGWWGMAYFLGTEVMLFAGLFAAFFVARAAQPESWAAARPHLDVALPLVTVNTIILITSGLTMHYALHAVQKDNRRGFIGGLVGTILLGGTFLAIQMKEYADLIAHGVRIDGGSFGSIFYLLTGTHAFHVALGLVFISVVLVRALLHQFDAKRHVAVDTFAIYWHFVDLVWVLLYLIVYWGLF